MKITVIMPLYNAQRFLTESLDSVLEQEIEDFELLCIDDASSDSTRQILERYRQNDKRLQIMSNEIHLGAAISRNRGIKAARGEYIVFLDGDDVFERDMLAEAYIAAKRYDADLVEYQYKVASSERIQEEAYIYHSDAYKKRFCQGVFSVEQMRPCEFMNFHAGPCTRIYRREFIEREGLEFQDLPCSNDVYFVSMALFLADKIHLLDNEKVMLHVREHDTPTRISSHRDPRYAFEADKKVAEELVARGRMEKVYRQFYYRVYCHLLITLKNVKKKKIAENFYRFLSDEGIDMIIGIGKEYFQRTDQYIQTGLQRFKNESYESGWYEAAGELESYLYDNIELLKKLFASWKTEQMKIGLWGAGQNGQIFLDFCRQSGFSVDAVIDSDEKKRGKIISGFTPVCIPDEVCSQLQIIILTSSNLVSDVSRIIREKKWKLQICDINLYLGR